MSDPLRIRSGGSWISAATATQPLKLKMPNGTWRVFGGGTGTPLYQKQPDGSWRVVAREGFGVDVVVPATSYTFNPGFSSRGGRSLYATANQSGSTFFDTSFLRTGTGGVDYLSKEVGTTNESGHYTTGTKRMTHGYFDLRQMFDVNTTGQPHPFPVLPPGVEFPYDTWVQVDVSVSGYATYSYDHHRASGLSVIDIRDAGTDAAWSALEHTLTRVDPSTVPTETVPDEGQDWTLATPLYHEPGGTPLLAVSSGGGPQSTVVPLVRADLDDDVFAFTVTAESRPSDPPTHPEYSAGWTNWEAFTAGGSATFQVSFTVYWPSWTYHST